MHLTTENILLVGSILLILSIFAGKTSPRLGVPTLILFLIIGMLAGSEGIGGIAFDNPKLTKFVGIVALNFILFSGGLETTYASIRPILWQGIALSTLGVLITAISIGLFVSVVAGFSLYEGLLLGAIVSSTDAAAVFSILRSKNIGLKNNLRPLLELESGSNDPMAYFLTIAIIGLIENPDRTLISVIPQFFGSLFIGTASGLIFGFLSKQAINRIRLDFEGLYPVLLIGLQFATFSATDAVHGNGFLAVYICALYLGNQELIHKKTLIKAFDGFAWLMQIVLFLTLGLLVYPSKIVAVVGIGLLCSAFLIFFARPVSVFISLMFFKMKNRSRWFVSWVGLRGAVPIVFATYPLLEGIEKAELIFNIVFFISVTSVLIQGTTLTMVARWLHVIVPDKAKQKSPLDIELSDSIKSLLVEMILPPGNPAAGQRILDLAFPKSTMIALIQRDGKYITPKGSTVLEANDKLLVLSDNREHLEEVYHILALDREIG
ncbi:potassium/proton antiporter [Pollutibacter soli]|uniref:potassium/proton antiporter n=1 Tax=Pollutibacter soli TaxID=3034157 RepID=UPI0030132768